VVVLTLFTFTYRANLESRMKQRSSRLGFCNVAELMASPGI